MSLQELKTHLYEGIAKSNDAALLEMVAEILDAAAHTQDSDEENDRLLTSALEGEAEIVAGQSVTLDMLRKSMQAAMLEGLAERKREIA